MAQLPPECHALGMEQHLREIVERGAPAQAAEADRLLGRLRADPNDAAAAATGRALVEAYLNDPDLVR